MPSSKKTTKVKMLPIHEDHSLYHLKRQQKPMNSLKNPQDTLLECHCFTQKSLLNGLLFTLDLYFLVFLLRNHPLAKMIGESPGLPLISFIFHSSLELQKFTFLKEKIGHFLLSDSCRSCNTHPTALL